MRRKNAGIRLPPIPMSPFLIGDGPVSTSYLMPMKKLFVLATLSLVPAAFAADVAYSPPVGGFTSVAAANTDTLVSPSLARAASWVGALSGASGTTINASTANWTAGQFNPGTDTYYVRVLSGALKGQYFVVTGNTASALTVDAAGMNLASIVTGDTAEIVPFWTLGTLYPSTAAGVAFIASTSALARQTELLFMDATGTGVNRAPSSTYYYFNGAWRKSGSSVTLSFNNTLVYPDAYFIQRNKAASTSLVYVGRVQPGALGTVIQGASTQNDNFVAVSFPVDIKLQDLGLIGNGFSASPSALAITDRLLVFDPNQTGNNRAPSASYFYFNGAWRKSGQPVTNSFNTDVVRAGSGFIIRKAANASDAAWSYTTGF